MSKASYKACSAFTRVTACTLALSPVRDTLPEGFSYFVTSIAAPVASGWSGRRVGLAPTGKRRLVTAHGQSGHRCGIKMVNITAEGAEAYRIHVAVTPSAPNERRYECSRDMLPLTSAGAMDVAST